MPDAKQQHFNTMVVGQFTDDYRPDEKYGVLSRTNILSLIEQTGSISATAGSGRLYVKSSDGMLYFLTHTGSEYNLTLGGGTSGVSFTVANGGNAVAVTIAQNDVTNNPRAVDITNASTANALRITQTGVIAASRSVGGALNVNNGTVNTGNAAVFYSNVGNTSTGRVVHITADNSAFAHEALYVESDSQTTTVFGIVGHAHTQGVIKNTHIHDAGDATDANASGFSIDLQSVTPSDTACQGIFITSTTGGTTGPILNLRNNLLAFGGADSQVELLKLLGNGQVQVGPNTPDASAQVQIDSTTRGFLPPRMTTTQRDAIAAPLEGLMIYNLTTHKLNVFTTAWEAVTSA